MVELRGGNAGLAGVRRGAGQERGAHAERTKQKDTKSSMEGHTCVSLSLSLSLTSELGFGGQGEKKKRLGLRMPRCSEDT